MSPLKYEVGPRIYDQGLAVATRSFQPPFDRAAIARRIVIENASANDNWQVIVGGRELMRFRVLTTGNQRPLLIPTASTAYQPQFFDFVRIALGLDASIPVPLGMTLQIASVGGATADVLTELKEVDQSDADRLMLNHYKGNVFLIPIFCSLAASQALPAAVALDTQVAPPWIPSIISGAAIPANWKIELLALFTEGMGVNTFSGAANHQSITDSLRVFKDQIQWFTRAGGGIPDVGSASAAGSANTVFGQRAAIFPPFQLSQEEDASIFDPPITLQGGESLQQLLNITGDLTGGASYANCLIMWVARVTVPGPTYGGQA